MVDLEGLDSVYNVQDSIQIDLPDTTKVDPKTKLDSLIGTFYDPTIEKLEQTESELDSLSKIMDKEMKLMDSIYKYQHSI